MISMHRALLTCVVSLGHVLVVRLVKLYYSLVGSHGNLCGEPYKETTTRQRCGQCGNSSVASKAVILQSTTLKAARLRLPFPSSRVYPLTRSAARKQTAATTVRNRQSNATPGDNPPSRKQRQSGKGVTTAQTCRGCGACAVSANATRKESSHRSDMYRGPHHAPPHIFARAHACTVETEVDRAKRFTYLWILRCALCSLWLAIDFCLAHPFCVYM